MPMHHKIACLRDDAVFVCFLVQRCLYPVDKRRANEYGIAYERDDEHDADAPARAPPALPPPTEEREHAHAHDD